MGMRWRARIIAAVAIAVVAISVFQAGGWQAAIDREVALAAADPSSAVASAPSQATDVTREAFDLLLDNFVTPPPPAVLLKGAAAEIVKRASEVSPGEWITPNISDTASRDDAYAAFGAWLDRVARLVSPTIDRAALDEIAVRALTETLSEHHTRYLSPRQNDEYQAWRRGDVRYEGIGARFRRPSTVVLEVFDGSPAERAGLRKGDRVIAVDGASIADASTENAISRIRGPRGSTVELTIVRQGQEQPVQLTVERGEISMPFVRWEVLARDEGSRYGYLQIRGFPEPSVDERVGQALVELDKQNINGLILDLRGNTGGRIDVGIKVASRFMRDGVVFQQVDRGGRERQVRTTGGYWERSIPMVTLVDSGTASMGEILSAALQDAGVSRIVGMTTSGSVAGARLFGLANGGALQITVLTITSARGKTLNDVGVVPDESVELSDQDLLSGVDAQLEAALDQLVTAARKLGAVTESPLRGLAEAA